MLPHRLRKIEDYAFAGCWSLEEIEIPDSVEKIAANAFKGCYKLKTIEVPQGVIIERDAFDKKVGLDKEVIKKYIYKDTKNSISNTSSNSAYWMNTDSNSNSTDNTDGDSIYVKFGVGLIIIAGILFIAALVTHPAITVFVVAMIIYFAKK